MNRFPELSVSQIHKIKVLVLFTLAFVIGICVYDNKENVRAVILTTYENELPVYSVDTDQKVVSITFDAAWGDEDIDEILEILESHDCKATFFTTGDWATRYPNAIKKIFQAGHDIGSHGANHKHMTQLNREEMVAEIEGCHTIINTMIGMDMNLFRAPYGDYSESVVITAKSLGYYTIQWDVDSLDWKDYGVESIIDTVCNNKNLRNGSIILLHNGSQYTRYALDELLTKLEENGYTFLPVSELIYTDNFYIDHTGRQFSKEINRQ